MIHIFSPQVMHVAVILGKLAHRLLQQRKVLAAGFVWIGIMIQAELIGSNATFFTFPDIFKHLVNRAYPAVTVTSVYFFFPEPCINGILPRLSMCKGI
ncbi:hypothetical protein D3C73_1432920 [compost metagenome]